MVYCARVSERSSALLLPLTFLCTEYVFAQWRPVPRCLRAEFPRRKTCTRHKMAVVACEDVVHSRGHFFFSDSIPNLYVVVCFSSAS